MDKKKRNNSKSDSKSKASTRNLKGKERPVVESNPFDIRKQKYKFSTADKPEAYINNTSKSRAHSINKRENTLGLEYDRRTKKNNYNDRRFKYLLDDDNISHDDKMLIMFQQERQKQWEQNDVYSVGNEIQLTHGGAAIFDDEEDFDFDSESNFGGMQKTNMSRFGDDIKSKDEVMKDIISKSKAYRYQKSMEREKRIEMTDQLDEDLKDIKTMLFDDTNKYQDKLIIKERKTYNDDEDSISVEEIEGDIAAEILALDKKNKKKARREAQDPMDEDIDPFDRLLFEMEDDKRAAPTAALLTDDDIAKAEMQKLQQLENERLQRMKGDDEDAHDGTIGGDDLIDDYLVYSGDAGKEKKKNRRQKKLYSDTIVPLSIQKDTAEITNLSVEDDIPFIIVMPSSFKNFNKMVEGQNVPRTKLIIERIRACNHISLLPENKDKMKKFLGYLFERFDVVSNKSPIDIAALDILVQPIFSLASQMPQVSSNIAKEKLNEIYERIKDSETWISNSDVLFFLLVTKIWPVSDKRHVVMTPSFMLISACLTKLKVTTLSDIVKGILLCDIFLKSTKESGRYTSEVLAFLQRIMIAFTGNEDVILHNAYCHSHDIDAALFQVSSWGKKFKKPAKLNLNNLFESEKKSTDKRLILSILWTTLSLMQEYFQQYKDAGHLEGMLYPVQLGIASLQKFNTNKFPVFIQEKKEDVQYFLNNVKLVIERDMRPLQYLLRKPTQLPMLTPKFQESYSHLSELEPDKLLRDQKRLQKQIKNEYKSAERELKRDAKYLARKKAGQEKILRKEDQDKTNKLYAFLEEQQHQKKVYTRMKAKKNF